MANAAIKVSNLPVLNAAPAANDRLVVLDVSTGNLKTVTVTHTFAYAVNTDVTAANLTISGPYVSASPAILGVGQFTWDDDYIYVGITAGVVKRVALESLP